MNKFHKKIQMTGRKITRKQKESKAKTFPIPFALEEIKEITIISSTYTNKTSKEELINKAFNFHKQGNISEATKYYQYFINQGSTDPRVFSNYGIILNDLGKLKEAELCLRKAIKIKPDSALAHSNLGNILKDQGKLKEAELSTLKATELEPNYAKGYSNLGVILLDQGKLKEAEIAIRKAIRLKPDLGEAHSNLGNILKDQGKLKEAELSYRKAIRFKPGFVDSYININNILQDKGNIKEAEIAIRKAIELKPDFAETHLILGNILSDLGKSKEAELSYLKAIEIKPDFAEAHSNLGNILSDRGKFKEAELYYLKAIEIKPDFAYAHSNLGTILIDLGKEKDAIKHYSLALEKEPNNIYFYINSKLKFSPIMNDVAQIEVERNKYKKQLENLKNNNSIYYKSGGVFKTDMFYLAYQNELDDKIILEELSNTISKVKGVVHEGFNGKEYLATSLKRTNLRLGICSEFLRDNHTIGKLYLKVILDLLQTDLEISIYVPPNTNSHSGLGLIRDSFKRVINLPSSPYRACELILSDKLDILFYPDIGMSNYTYILALSKLALVQVNSLGHTNTSGINNIDYYITNSSEPKESDNNYTEQLIRFNKLPFNYSTPLINSNELKNNNFLKFKNNFYIGITQSLFKLHPDFDQILESILLTINKSHLILIKDREDHCTQLLKNRWRKKSHLLIEKSTFLDRMSENEFMYITKSCDIMLDPFYYGSGNTFYESMAFGTPFITYKNQRSKIPIAGYKQMKVKKPPIATTQEDYINWCKVYAEESDLLSKTRKELIEKANKYLFNDNDIYKEYYKFFTDAVLKAKDGQCLDINWHM